QNRAPNTGEYVLHALAACVSGTIVYHAAARGIALDGLETTIEGDLDRAASSAWTAASAPATSRSGSPSRPPATSTTTSSPSSPASPATRPSGTSSATPSPS